MTITVHDASRMMRVNMAIERAISRSFTNAAEKWREGDHAAHKAEYDNALALARILGRITYEQTGVSAWEEL